MIVCSERGTACDPKPKQPDDNPFQVEDRNRRPGRLKGLGWRVTHGPDIQTQTEGAEQADYIEILLESRPRYAPSQLTLIWTD